VIGKIERRENAATTDRNGSEIKFGDTIREVTGEQRTGIVNYVHRVFVFCNTQVVGENGGMMVARANNVSTVAASGPKLNRTVPDLSKMNPNMAKSNGTGMPPPKTFGRRDRILGKTVSLRKGEYKGFLGTVKDITDDVARVELHAVNKTITIEKENLTVKEYVCLVLSFLRCFFCLLDAQLTRGYSPVTGQAIDMNRFGGGRGGGRTPMSAAPPGMQDSWNGGRTPMAAADSGRTPAWRASSSRSKYSL
jgi:transcription elongation factor SPT5